MINLIAYMAAPFLAFALQQDLKDRNISKWITDLLYAVAIISFIQIAITDASLMFYLVIASVFSFIVLAVGVKKNLIGGADSDIFIALLWILNDKFMMFFFYLIMLTMFFGVFLSAMKVIIPKEYKKVEERGYPFIVIIFPAYLLLLFL